MKRKKTLIAAFIYDALSVDDIVVIDVSCDYNKEILGSMKYGRADIAALEFSLKITGE